MTNKTAVILILMMLLGQIVGQTNKEGNLPKEIRGYKVHNAEVELKKPKQSETRNRRATDEAISSARSTEYHQDEPLLVRLGEAKLVSVSPLGVTFDVPVVIGAIKQEGDVDRLVFDDMKVNETSVHIDDYAYKFKLPNKEPLSLKPLLRIFVSTPQAVLRTIDEFLRSKEVWPVTGRVYVCGRFSRFFLKFKRAIPVELNTSIKNPLN